MYTKLKLYIEKVEYDWKTLITFFNLYKICIVCINTSFKLDCKICGSRMLFNSRYEGICSSVMSGYVLVSYFLFIGTIPWDFECLKCVRLLCWIFEQVLKLQCYTLGLRFFLDSVLFTARIKIKSFKIIF